MKRPGRNKKKTGASRLFAGVLRILFQQEAAVLRRGKERRRTKFLGGAAVTLFSFLIVCIFIFSSAQNFLLRSPQVAAVVSAVLIDLANQDRAASNLGALKINPTLVAAAQAKANDMVSKGYFAHVSPGGLDPWHWFEEAGYKFEYAGENLAVNFSDSSDVNTAWMNSPTHRENIMNPHFTEIGIATAVGVYQGQTTVFVVQEFGSPAGALAQAPVREVSIPRSPSEMAIATTKPAASSILGEEAKPAQKTATVAAEKKTAFAVATTSPAVAAILVEDVVRDPPAWKRLIGFPRDTLRYGYYLLALLILLALAFETGLELRWHHARHALTAGTMLATMCVLFVVADYLFFVEPVLAFVASAAGG